MPWAKLVRRLVPSNSSRQGSTLSVGAAVGPWPVSNRDRVDDTGDPNPAQALQGLLGMERLVLKVRLSVHAGRKAPQLQHIPDYCVLVYAHSPLTTPSSTSSAPLNRRTNQLYRILQVSARQRPCPTPYPAHHCWFWCLSHAMPGYCAVGCACARGADLGLASPRRHLQAHALTSKHHGPRPSCTRPYHQNANTDKPGAKSRAWDARRGAAWHPQVGSTLPAGAPFTKQRPPAEFPRSAPSNQHCLVEHACVRS